MPFTVPVVVTLAVAGAELLHEPPDPVVDKEIPEPWHTVDGPDIAPANGAGSTVMFLVVKADPQPLVTVYVIITLPALTPVTIPDVFTVANAVLLLLHAPPVIVGVSVVVAPWQTDVAPDNVPATGSGLTVMSAVSTAVPHELVTVYDMIAAPPATPATTPDVLTEAMVAALLLHVPPLEVVLKAVVAPWHTAVAPLTTPALGIGFTVIERVESAVPQLLVTE